MGIEKQKLLKSGRKNFKTPLSHVDVDAPSIVASLPADYGIHDENQIWLDA